MPITDYQAKYLAYELTKRCPSDSVEKLAGAVAGAHHPVAPLVLFQQRGREAVVAETTAALPTNRLRDAAGVLAIDHFLQSRQAMRFAMLDKAPPPEGQLGLFEEGGNL